MSIFQKRVTQQYVVGLRTLDHSRCHIRHLDITNTDIIQCDLPDRYCCGRSTRKTLNSFSIIDADLRRMGSAHRHVGSTGIDQKTGWVPVDTPRDVIHPLEIWINLETEWSGFL